MRDTRFERGLREVCAWGFGQGLRFELRSARGLGEGDLRFLRGCFEGDLENCSC